MEKTKALIKNAWPYKEDRMNLPVANLETAIPFYERFMGFQVIFRKELPHKSAVISRDEIQIGLAENGGDPSQDGCFFEVDSLEKALSELRSNGLDKKISGIEIHKHDDIDWKVFFVVAPDGLCYCYGERQNSFTKEP